MSLKFSFITDRCHSRTIRTKFMMAILAAAVGFSSLLPLDAQSDRHSIRLQNDSSYAIYEVFISPVYQQTWGLDKLGDNASSDRDTTRPFLRFVQAVTISCLWTKTETHVSFRT